MKIIITESQYDMIRFRRRLNEFDEFIRQTPAYSSPCAFVEGSEAFFNAVFNEVTDELYADDQVSDEFIDMVEKYMMEVKYTELIEYYNERCSVVTESRLDNFIYQYLDDYFRPDYNWGPDLHDFYRKDVKKHGYYDFTINGRTMFVYLLRPLYLNLKNKTLLIYDNIYLPMNRMFGERWKPVFMKWFDDHTGLDVEDVKYSR